VLVTVLLAWISKYAVRTYATPDSAVTSLNHAQMAQTTLHRRLLYDVRLPPKVVKTVRMRAEWGLNT